MATMQVVVTGGAGQIAYSLIPLIARGVVFGPGVRVNLRLLDIPPSAKALEGGTEKEKIGRGNLPTK